MASQLRAIMQKVLAECVNETNLWKLFNETSDAGYNLTHFEIYCDDEMAKSFNAIISGKAVYHF